MSKWLQRFIAALLLLTFQPGLPVPVQIQNDENNAPYAAQSVFNLGLVKAAEAADNTGSWTDRLGAVIFFLFLVAIVKNPSLLSLIMGIGFICWLISYVFNG